MLDLEIRASSKLSPTILIGSSRSQYSCHSVIACGCFTQASTTTTIIGQGLISHHLWIARARRRWIFAWHFFTVYKNSFSRRREKHKL